MHTLLQHTGGIPENFRIAILALLLLALTCAAPIAAHPASGMDLRYDTTGQQLLVTITHPVGDPATHFIRQVTIRYNGTTLTYPYTSQPARDSMTYQYSLPLETPGPVEVTASCNIGGDLTRTLYNTATATTPAGSGPSGTDPSVAAPDTPASPSIPGPMPLYAFLWPVHAIFMVIGVIFLLSAILMVTYWKTRSGWYKLHRLLAGTGAVIAATGLAIAWYMVSTSGGPNFRAFHGIFGAITLAVLFLTLLLGVARDRAKQHKVALRAFHIWAGRIAFVLLVLAVLLGLRQAGLFL